MHIIMIVLKSPDEWMGYGFPAARRLIARIKIIEIDGLRWSCRQYDGKKTIKK